MALTLAQTHQHIGRMLDDVTNTQQGRDWFSNDKLVQFVRAAKFYRNNGTLGTLADRTEAMRTFIRQLFQRCEGLDPAVKSHYFLSHWIEDVEPGDSGNYA